MSSEFATPHLLQTYAEKKSAEMGLFKDISGILPFVVMIVSDFEEVCSVDYKNAGLSFVDLIKKKTLEARHETWHNFLSNLNLPLLDKEELKEFVETVMARVEPLMQPSNKKDGT